MRDSNWTQIGLKLDSDWTQIVLKHGFWVVFEFFLSVFWVCFWVVFEFVLSFVVEFFLDLSSWVDYFLIIFLHFFFNDFSPVWSRRDHNPKLQQLYWNQPLTQKIGRNVDKWIESNSPLPLTNVGCKSCSLEDQSSLLFSTVKLSVRSGTLSMSGSAKGVGFSNSAQSWASCVRLLPPEASIMLALFEWRSDMATPLCLWPP